MRRLGESSACCIDLRLLCTKHGNLSGNTRSELVDARLVPDELLEISSVGADLCIEPCASRDNLHRSSSCMLCLTLGEAEVDSGKLHADRRRLNIILLANGESAETAQVDLVHAVSAVVAVDAIRADALLWDDEEARVLVANRGRNIERMDRSSDGTVARLVALIVVVLHACLLAATKLPDLVLKLTILVLEEDKAIVALLAPDTGCSVPHLDKRGKVPRLDLLPLDEDEEVDVEQEAVLGNRVVEPDAVDGAEVLDALTERAVDLLEDELEVDPALLVCNTECLAVLQTSERTGCPLVVKCAPTLLLEKAL